MHIEIGRNIDYSAPGHYSGRPSVPCVSVSFFERTSFTQLSVEIAYYEALKNPIAKSRWMNFNRTKEHLYNGTMVKLGLIQIRVQIPHHTSRNSLCDDRIQSSNS